MLKYKDINTNFLLKYKEINAGFLLKYKDLRILVAGPHSSKVFHISFLSMQLFVSIYFILPKKSSKFAF